jgi:hypothetical protein
MSDSPNNPDTTRPRVDKEFEDPHYHDEDLDIQADDGPREGRSLAPKKKTPRKLPPLPRRHYED